MNKIISAWQKLFVDSPLQDIILSFFTTFFFLELHLGVGGMSKGLQILLLGILFQVLHHNNTKFWTKNQVLSFTKK